MLLLHGLLGICKCLTNACKNYSGGSCSRLKPHYARAVKQIMHDITNPTVRPGSGGSKATGISEAAYA